MQYAGRQGRRNYVLVAVTLILLLAAAFIPGEKVAAANETKIVKKNDKFTVTAEYGLNGMAYYDSPLQAVVTVESKENFNGVLRIISDTDSSQLVAGYGKRITLAAGEAKTYKMTVNTPSGLGEVHLAIMNENDKVLYEEKTFLNVTSSGGYSQVGVLSDDYSGVGYFNGVSVQYTGSGSSSTSTIEFTGDSFPEDWQVLKMVNYLVIDNFDTSSLSEKQYDALKRWVNNGGVLILSLGSHYQNVLSGFKDDFVSGSLGAISKKTLTWNTTEETLTLNDVECMSFSLDDGEEFADFSTDKTAYVKKVGLGNVVVLSYSLSMEPMSTFTRRNEVASMLLSSSASSVTENIMLNGGYDNKTTMGMDLISISENIRKPSTVLYGLLLTLYVVLVGPLLYLILKKTNKREKIWIAIPVVAFVFTGIIYLTSFIYRINKPLLNTFSLISADEEGASETVYSSVVCPSAKKYTLKLNDTYDEVRYNYNQYDYSMFGNNTSAEEGKYDYMLMDNGTDREMILNSSSAFKSFGFTAGRVADEGVGHFTLNLDCKTSGFSGTVTNDTAYDLTDVVVNYETHLYLVGDLKKGETATIDEGNLIQTQGYGTFDNLYSGTAAGSISYQQYRIDSNIESYILSVSEYCTGHVWGTIGSYKPDLMDDSQIKQSGLAVIIDDFYQEYSDVSGAFYPDISNMLIDSQGEFDSSNGYMYDQGGTVTATYSFTGFGDIDTLMLNNAILDDGEYAEVYAFNVDTGNFEKIFDGTDTLSGTELAKYMSHGIIQLRYEQSGNAYQSYYIPRISASGKGK